MSILNTVTDLNSLVCVLLNHNQEVAHLQKGGLLALAWKEVAAGWVIEYDWFGTKEK